MDKFLRASTTLCLAALLLHSPAFAYDSDLSDTAVREAYFLGQRHDDKTRAFFAPYITHPPLPKKGPYISEIGLFTPLAQVVQASNEVTSGYSAQQAQLDYRRRGNTILVIVHIEFTATYGAIEANNSVNTVSGKKGLTLRPEDFWQDFRYGIRQTEDWIEPRVLHGEPQYASSDGSGSGSGLVGAWVFVEYDAHNVPSESTEVHIFNPDGQETQTTFNLSKLR